MAKLCNARSVRVQTDLSDRGPSSQVCHFCRITLYQHNFPEIISENPFQIVL
jgi:hypothetical protein